VSAQVTCTVTGFAGMEAQILRLRNANRENPETLAYLNWRYQSSPEAPAPCVFWLLDPAGEPIGMASAIFRPYWLEGACVQTAVIGDISLDARWRRRGLGQVLLRYMTQHLETHFPSHPALVIPTESARRALAQVGWVTAGSLAPLVYVLDFAPYAQRILRSGVLARGVSRAIRAGVRPLIRRRAPRDGALHVGDVPDASLPAFVRGLSDTGAVARDLGPRSVNWRYTQHPHTQFRFATFRRAGETRGFLVFEDSSAAGTCAVYDLAAAGAQDLQAMLALFMLRSFATPRLVSLRVLLDEQHPWRSELQRLGFIARPTEAVFQVHSGDGRAACWSWRVTQGDKDT
jgi:GNAT superfamily N-acetyltransferase